MAEDHVSSGNGSQSIVRTAFHVVQPRQVPVPSVHFLSNMDLTVLSPEFARVMLFFRDCFSPATGAKAVLEDLRSSLSGLLAAYPVLAGRLQKSDSADGRLSVSVNGQGVHFVEATVNSALRDWQDLRHCPLKIDLSLDSHVTDLYDTPLINFQVTQFRCGGLAIAINFIHVVFDADTLLRVLRTWAEIHRGNIISYPLINSSNSNSSKHSFFLARKPLIVDSPVHVMIDSTDKECSDSNLIPRNALTLRIERSAVDACKHEVETGSFAYGKVTGFEAVSSMLWSSVLRARGIPNHLDASFMFPVNLRSPNFPDVPANYFGNALAVCQAHAPRTSDVVNSDLSYAARLIRKAKLSCNWESVQSMLDLVEVNPGGMADVLHRKRGILLTSHTSFSYYSINFGWRGGALAQFILLPYRVPPYIDLVMLPSPRSDAVDIVATLHDQDRDRLFEDPRFTKYFSPKEIKLWTGDCIRKALKALKK